MLLPTMVCLKGLYLASLWYKLFFLSENTISQLIHENIGYYFEHPDTLITNRSILNAQHLDSLITGHSIVHLTTGLFDYLSTNHCVS